jgi:cobaltochelatase CobT
MSDGAASSSGHASTVARHQQRVEELCGAAVRALSGEHDLHFRARRLYRGTRLLPIGAPHLYPSLTHDDFSSFRGAADGLALRVAHSDAERHESLMPQEPVARLVFELLEQQRAESLVPEVWRGVRENLRHRFEAWSAAFIASGLTENTRGLLLYTLAQTSRARLTGEPVHEPSEDMIESTRGHLVGAIGTHLAWLRRERHDQAAFAPHALAIAHAVAAMVTAEEGTDSGDAVADQANGDAQTGFTLLVDFDDDGDDAFAMADHGTSRVLEQAGHRYSVFTRAHDQQHDAARLVRADELRELRERLDQRIARSGLNIGRLVRQFKALLAQPAHDDWDGGQDEGRIDGRRLAQLIASPGERRLFRTEHFEPQARCRLTLLIDCSGSMKQHNEPVALLADVMARALEQAGVEVEVLGFTTAAWNGGRAAKEWQRAGKPPHPGRLNEVRHLVFKQANASWRRARLGLAALQKNELFREGIDGEAVEWACTRLREAADDDPIDRRILIVISDGSPMDAATNLANDAHYLDHHLRQVVEQQGARGDIEILGLGVGLDLSPYYSRCQALDLSTSPTQATFGDVIELIAGHRHR